jgi:cysteine-rich repeat protein
VIDSGEECDDGANNGPGKACTALCKESNCGDGIVQPDEECDDGNSEGADDNTDSCLSTCQWNVCGDGAVYVHKTDNGNTAAIEQCDDANDVESDRCLASCKYNVCGDNVKLADVDSEPYLDPDFNGPMTASRCIDTDLVDCGIGPDADDWYELPWALVGSGDFPAATFGTGGFDPSYVMVEECDDGNNVDTDSCRKTSTGSGGVFQCLYNVCGDGQKYTTITDASNPNAVEECDDANGNNGDSCIDTCKFNICGDGFEQANVTDSTEPGGTAGGDDEECDDGNAVNTDGCSAACKDSECGDGYLNPATEQCDDGDGVGVGADAATDICDGTEAGGCVLSHGLCRAGAGDGVLNPGEECDDGNDVDTDSCNNHCHRPRCGDGILYLEVTDATFTTVATELCDDGNSSNRDDCLATCAPASCGDGFILHDDESDENDEECDLGTANGGDVCTAACTSAECGDGIVQTGEACDDGNDDNDDGCTEECKLNVCGDGYFDPETEACDDGEDNGTTGSECDANCALNACHNPDATAGDIADLDCHDGNDINTDLCTNRCLIAVCGDGIVSAVNHEECDDGNDDATDSCTNACTWNMVGDGVRYTTKTDEGNPNLLHNCDSGELYGNHENEDAPMQNLSAAARDDGFVDGADFCAVAGEDEDTTSNLRCPSLYNNVVTNPNRPWASFIDAADTCIFALEDYELSGADEGYNDAGDVDYDDWTGTWEEASAACAGLGWGAKLVVINNSSITRAVVGEVVDAVYDSANDGDNAWIGLEDRARPPSTIVDGPGAWFWIDNSQGPAVNDVTAWRAGNPDQDNDVDVDQEDCGAITFDQDTDEGGADTAEGWQYTDEECDDEGSQTIAVCAFTCTAEGNCQQ